MIKYIHIIIFLITHDLTELKKCWLKEHMFTDIFTWRRLLFRIIKNKKQCNFYFWWRLANAMYLNGSQHQKKAAEKIQDKLISKYSTEIQLGAKIGLGLNIVHFVGVEISNGVEIGDNFTCHHFVTIGWNNNPFKIKIGNNVTVGCNSTVLGGEINVGNNVYIGAMSFINKDIPDNCTVITEKTNKIILNTI